MLMKEPKLTDFELYAIFENCGWYKGRKEDLNNRLPKGYDELPDGVYSFIQEFFGLKLEYEYEFEYEDSGVLEKDTVESYVILCPDMGYDGELDDTAHRHYSNLIGEELYSIGIINHSYVALDADLNMYIFEMGFGCLRISDNPIDGLRKILLNSLYKDVYELREKGENQYEWRKRKSSFD